MIRKGENMLITFTVKDQKITHDLKQSLVAGSVGIVKARFAFDDSWLGMDKVLVFSSSSCPRRPSPIRWDDKDVSVPSEALLPGKMFVSVVGFGPNGARKTTQAWDIQQAITVTKCGLGGSWELLRNMVQVPDDKVANDDDFGDMMNEVFGDYTPEPSDPPTPEVSEKYVATDEEVQMMFDEIFGSNGPAPEYPV